jgi:hypothetical protein
VKDGKPVMWTSDHVFAALQLRSAGQGSKEETDGFVVIRYDTNKSFAYSDIE